MPIVVNSPYSGESVKIRDQDVGRAVKDRDGKVFYVLPRSDGSGYYAALTRQGGAKDEQRYDEMAGKMQQTEQHVQVETADHHEQAAVRKQSSKRGKLVILVLLIIVLVVAYYGYKNFWNKWQKGPQAGDIPMGAVPTSLWNFV